MRNHIVRFLLALCLVLFLVFPVWSEEPQHYCDDIESWVEWNELVQKYPQDMDLQTLHAFRIGLCAKIKEGTISVVYAIVLFERARNIIVEEARQREMTKDKHL